MMRGDQTVSLRTFLNKVIDYAGLYPPASLSLEDAIGNFVRYQDDPEIWMLACFIIPAKRLAELSKLVGRAFPGKGFLSFSALGRGGKDADEFLQNISLDISEIQTFREAYGDDVLVDVFEVALPADILSEPAGIHTLLNRASDVLNKNGLAVFFEAPSGDGWQSRAEKLIRSLRKIKDKHVGFKLRTGGVVADAFPSPEQVAWAIVAARDAGVPMKATAGLHHPVRHYNEGVQTKMHGFLNVFGAGVLACTHHLGLKEIQAILEDEDPSSFVFDEAGFAWKDVRISTEQIAQTRGSITSFGSCSFDEPREDLRTLGLLKP